MRRDDHPLDAAGKARGGGYLAADKTDAAKALDAVLDDLKKAKDDIAAAKKDFDKLADDKKKADDSIKTLMTDLDKSKKDNADSLTKIKKLEDDVKAEQAKVAAEMDKVKAGLVRIDKLQAEKKGLEDTIIATGDKVGLRNIDPVRSKGLLFQKLDDVMDVVGTKDPQGRLMASMGQIRDLSATLNQRWTPEVMLGYWMPLLGDRGKQFANPALEDVERVKANPKAPLEVRGQAQTVEGLALPEPGRVHEGEGGADGGGQGRCGRAVVEARGEGGARRAERPRLVVHPAPRSCASSSDTMTP